MQINEDVFPQYHMCNTCNHMSVTSSNLQHHCMVLPVSNSVPLTWEFLELLDFTCQKYTIRRINKFT